jgi:hypothetical protein
MSEYENLVRMNDVVCEHLIKKDYSKAREAYKTLVLAVIPVEIHGGNFEALVEDGLLLEFDLPELVHHSLTTIAKTSVDPKEVEGLLDNDTLLSETVKNVIKELLGKKSKLHPRKITRYFPKISMATRDLKKPYMEILQTAVKKPQVS